MALKIVLVFCAALGYAQAILFTPADTLDTAQVPTLAQTVDPIASKQLYTSMHKVATRVHDNVHKPQIYNLVDYAVPLPTHSGVDNTPQGHTTAKRLEPAPVVERHLEIVPTFAYAPPAHTKAIYVASAKPTSAYTVTDVTKANLYAAPAVNYATPVSTKTFYEVPSPMNIAKPMAYAVPHVGNQISHGLSATAHTYNGPRISEHTFTKTGHYSPAESVSHMSFNGFGTHWEY